MEEERALNLLKLHALERDRIEFSAGDVLDVKAGLLLVMLIFLAGQTEALFRGSLTIVQEILGWISIAAMTLGAFFSVFELFPRKYSVLSQPSRFREWFEDVQKYYADKENTEHALILAERTEIAQAAERAEQNSLINKRKTVFMKGCFYCVVASFMANLLALIFSRLFPPSH